MAQRPEFFNYHKAALHALRHQLPPPAMQDGQPQGGYYFIRKIKDGPKLPVAIFEDDMDAPGETIITIDGYPIARAEHNKTWLICARHPVPWEAYEARLETGAWPGESAPEPAAAGEGHNAPPETMNGAPIGPEPEPTADIILAREIDAAKLWLETTPIDSDERADEAATRVAELRRLKALVAELHREEKAPHQAKCDEIDEKYLSLIRETARDPRNIGRAVLAINFLLGKINTFWKKKKDDEAAAAKVEADRQAELQRMTDAAVASAQKSNAVQGSPPPDLPAPPTMPPMAVPPPPSRQTAGGIVGKRITSRIKTIAVIDDQDKVYQHFRDNAQVKALLLKLAQTMIDAKQPVPGVSTREEEFAK